MVWVVIGVAIPLSVLEHSSKEVENDIASKIGIEYGVYAGHLAILNELDNGEWVCVVAGNKSDTVNSHE